MPDPITWYALGRTVDDVETIMEMVDAKLLTHNQDDSAHGQSNEAVYNHRIASLLDHISYSIYNVKMNPQSRVFKAIVSSGPEGDFATLQAAVDWVNLYGGGKVLIKSGTYTLSQNLVLYSNIELEGEDDDLVTVQFSTNAYSVQIKGMSGNHKRNITISRINFIGWNTLDDYRTIDLDYADDVLIERCKFTEQGASNEAYASIYPYRSNRINISQCRFLEVDRGIYVNNSDDIKVKDNYFYQTSGDNIGLFGADHVVVEKNYSDTCGTALVYDWGSSDKTKITQNTVIDSGDFGVISQDSNQWIITNNHFIEAITAYGGVSLNGGARNIVAFNECIGGSSDGIQLSGSDHNIIHGNICTNNGSHGIDIINATCDRNIISNNQSYSNTSGQINDSGTNTVLDNNVTTA